METLKFIGIAVGMIIILAPIAYALGFGAGVGIIQSLGIIIVGFAAVIRTD